ncbi:MAG: hypothetical protein K6G85_09805 [Eubacterium sp.]|nr:hypothetical protein [Eubacterium sp.]
MFNPQKFELIKEILTNVFALIRSALYVGVLVTIFFLTNNSTTRIILIPFLICFIAFFIKEFISFKSFMISHKKMNEDYIPIEDEAKKINSLNKVTSFFSKLYNLGFFLFWFPFLIFADYIAIKNNRKDLLIGTLIFWIVGIVLAVSTFKKTNRTE